MVDIIDQLSNKYFLKINGLPEYVYSFGGYDWSAIKQVLVKYIHGLPSSPPIWWWGWWGLKTTGRNIDQLSNKKYLLKINGLPGYLCPYGVLLDMIDQLSNEYFLNTFMVYLDHYDTLLFELGDKHTGRNDDQSSNEYLLNTFMVYLDSSDALLGEKDWKLQVEMIDQLSNMYLVKKPVVYPDFVHETGSHDTLQFQHCHALLCGKYR